MSSKLELPRVLRRLAQNSLPTIGMLSAFPTELGFADSNTKKGSGNTKKGSGKLELNQQNLDDRVNLLVKSGHETRLALSNWRAVEERYFESPHNAAFWVEEAALNLRQVVLLEDEDPLDILEETKQTTEERLGAAKDNLDEIAAKVLESPNSCFTTNSSTTNPIHPDSVAELQFQQLQLLAKVICHEMDLKQQPYEWVYDGLKPLLVDTIFGTRKGTHISLAALYCAVGRRLECPLLPSLASRSASPGALAGLSLATAPAPDPWLVRVASDMDLLPEQQFQADFVFHPSTASAKFSHMLQSLQAGQISPLPFWIGLLRTAMLAHQRRGDGDAVAHCMYQLIALDWHAPEWGTALQPSAIGRA